MAISKSNSVLIRMQAGDPYRSLYLAVWGLKEKYYTAHSKYCMIWVKTKQNEIIVIIHESKHLLYFFVPIDYYVEKGRGFTRVVGMAKLG